MKKLMLVALLLVSNFAHAEKKEILCQKRPHYAFGERLSLQLDNSGVDPDSGLFRIARTSWSYQYSGAFMQCSGGSIFINGVENFKCFGYVNGAWGLELKVSLKNGKGTAQIHHVDSNVYDGNEGDVLFCSLVKPSRDFE